LLRTFDDWAAANGVSDSVEPSESFEPTLVEPSLLLGLDFKNGEIRTIIWATGYRPDYSWLSVPVVDHKGQLKHDGGVVSAPGIFALGLPFLRRRKSSFIHGAEDDVRDLSQNLSAYLDQYAARRTARIAV
jgi:putative flavoprotein involved in K+ transport